MQYLNMTTSNDFPCKYGKICPKNPKKTFFHLHVIFFYRHNAKFYRKETNDHDPTKLSSTQLYFGYHQKPLHETAYKFLISQFLNQHSKSYSI